MQLGRGAQVRCRGFGKGAMRTWFLNTPPIFALTDEVIGLIFDPSQHLRCCFGVVTKAMDGMTCFEHE
jgi:hypothetical protein